MITKLFGSAMILKILLSTISSAIHFFVKQKFCIHHFSWSKKITNSKDETIDHSSIYLLFDLLWQQKSIS